MDTTRISASRIGRTTIMVLVGTVLAVTLGMTAVSYHQARKVHERQLAMLQGSQSRNVAQILDDRADFASYIASRPMVRRFLAAHADGARPEERDARTLEDYGRDLLRTDVVGMSVRDPIGRELYRTGSLAALPASAVAVTVAERDGWLYWSGGPVLRSLIPVEEGLRGVGSVMIDQRMPRLSGLMDEFHRWGETGEMVLCGKVEAALQCLPLRFRNVPSRLETMDKDGVLSPVFRAIRGERSTGFAQDYREQRVLAAWGPVGDSRLGLVVKMDGSEVFEDLRDQIIVSAVVLIASLLLGLAVVRTRVSPLVARLRASERLAVATNGALRQATDSLQLSERRLRTIADNLPVLIACVNRDGRYTFANRAFEEMVGVSPEQAVGRTIREVLGDTGWERVRPATEEALAGFPVSYERIHPGRDGDRVFQATYVPDYAADGTVLGFHAMVQDATSRKRSEEALRAGKARLRTITDNVPVLIGYIDRERIYRFNNRTYQDWFGRPLNEITDRPVVEVIGRELYDRSAGYMDRALAGEQVTFEYDLEGETVRHLSATFVPDTDDTGAVIGIYTVTQDVTAATLVAKELNRMARFDALTGLPNRAMLGERIARALPRAKREGHAIALLYLDLDRFKAINDTLGHAAGDTVLQEFGRRLSACVRETDTVARLAGDEFVVLLETVRGSHDAEVVAEKILGVMSTPMIVEDVPLAVRTSIGVALDEAAVCTEASLLEAADAALYEAKGKGRGTYAMRRPAATLMLARDAA